MKSFLKYLSAHQFIIHLFFIVLIIGTLLSGFKIKETPISLTVEPFAVVELFTSEGCSSCPPADKLLTKLVDLAEMEDLNIFALSFHVSYWDYLGWKDPFASDAFTNRQRKYARKLGSGVYTPQMVVNGQSEFVGSDQKRAEEVINMALSNRFSEVKFEKVSIQKTQSTVSVTFEIIGELKNKTVHLALVERDLSVSVNKGENRGRALHHNNVVRKLKSINLSDQSSYSVQLPIDSKIKIANASLIVYLQNLDNLRIYDVAGSKL